MSRLIPAIVYKCIVLGLLWLVGFYMRLPMLAAAPLRPEINADYDITQSALGALTTLPVLMLGLGALPASLLIGRFGGAIPLCSHYSSLRLPRACAAQHRTLRCCCCAPASWVWKLRPCSRHCRHWCPGLVALGSSYINGMLVSEVAGEGLTLTLADGNWRMAFVLWSVPAVLIAWRCFAQDCMV